ncbi:MAG TPA: hypothetical protein VGY55_01000 [Pirellulales bacterium]|jgi:hypothetical protein|nr:hypothetical protein [Pirellulales bacterium]
MFALRRVGIVGVCLLGLVIACIHAGGADAPGEKRSEKLQGLLLERWKTSENAYNACTVGYEAGTLELDTVLTTSNEVNRAKLALCKSKEERIAVRQAHVARQNQIEGKIKALSNVNAKGGEADKLARASLNRVNAEIELELERNGAAAGENR